ncbi:uncharacterized protein EI90DRAFT_3149380 [Cantharellus anzutake]|uniref:uncharacterized protein n=1 Tax=Cantharellus anzutake TaxID=1750568 RepID=UPI0019042B19|nr:uncharacterized protein EI90DRAFT_3149380 [Cantharellus anzutake]KAF8343867.1 hypothetical protein EI90DRAFT_3149380 [Cantharellus anzutake]
MLSSIYPVGIALVGFTSDEAVPPQESTIAFTSSPFIAELVKTLGLPFTQQAAQSMRSLYDGVSAFSPYQPNAAKEKAPRAIDEDNVDFYTPVMKNEDSFTIEIDKEFGKPTECRKWCAKQLRMLISDKVGSADKVQDNWKSANILPLLLEHRL